MSDSAFKKSPDRLAVIFMAVLVSALGALFYNLLPLFLGAAQDARQLTDQAMGLLGSSFYLGFTLMAASAFFWIRRFNWRVLIGLASGVAAAALVTAGVAPHSGVMIGSTFVAGCAYSTLYGIGATIVADTNRPARWYGLKIASEAGLGALFLIVLPGTVIVYWGLAGLVIVMALATLAVLPLLRWLPSGGALGEREMSLPLAGALPAAVRMALWLALAALASFFFSITLVWAFVERIAAEAGFDPVSTGNVLSLTLVAAVSGSLAAMWLGDRLGLAKPFAAAGAVMLLSIAGLAAVVSLPGYAITTCLFSLAFGLGIPVGATTVAELDVDGRYVVLTVPAIGTGVMTAPYAGGLLAQVAGYGAILAASGAAVVIAVVLALTAIRIGIPLAARWRSAAAAPVRTAPDLLV